MVDRSIRIRTTSFNYSAHLFDWLPPFTSQYHQTDSYIKPFLPKYVHLDIWHQKRGRLPHHHRKYANIFNTLINVLKVCENVRSIALLTMTILGFYDRHNWIKYLSFLCLSPLFFSIHWKRYDSLCDLTYTHSVHRNYMQTPDYWVCTPITSQSNTCINCESQFTNEILPKIKVRFKWYSKVQQCAINHYIWFDHAIHSNPFHSSSKSYLTVVGA